MNHSATQGLSHDPVASRQRRPTRKAARRLLVGLMIPLLMMVVNMNMFGVATPAIREQYDLLADTTSWLSTVYTLPYVVAMPLYGRFGDAFGKRRIFLMGIVVFLVGTGLILVKPSLSMLIVGRIIQGIGVAGVSPLSISIISDFFPVEERGSALGTWNSMGPFAAVISQPIGGFIVDNLGWQAVYWPVLLIGAGALYGTGRLVAATEKRAKNLDFIRSFDWGGVIFLSLATVSSVFYLSSRPITGVAPLLDWRLLLAAVVFFGLFFLWERRQSDPFLDLGIFAYANFGRASLSASIRMFALSSLAFLVPLFLTDVYAMSASRIGTVTMSRVAAMLVTMRLGGRLADRWKTRSLILTGVAVQCLSILYFALLPTTASLWWLILGLVVNGLGSGFYLAPLHQAVMGHVPQDRTGVAAGLYGMIRFAGMILGSVLAGIVLQFGLDRAWPVSLAYRATFCFIAVVGMSGFVNGWGLQD